ncbi:phosphatase PAP2 family protein, partial [uncultured Sphingomonas sp.]|uniref:acid phosphatase n=1 Tax=uncultured Sphingomonas sp. TaxID=158754 RepID=UPI0035CA82F2
FRNRALQPRPSAHGLRRPVGETQVKIAASLMALALLGAADAPRDYLLPADMPDLVTILPPPAAPGSAQAVADRRAFIKTRALVGTGRWRLATADVKADRFDIFAEAIGTRLSARSAPALARVLERMSDGDMVGRAKRRFASPRPYLGINQPICEPKTAHLAGNGDYPSGHASSGWATALVLAELMPSRATAILRRGREFGESRSVCGSHSRSAVETGYMAGTVLVARLHGSAEFRRDMDVARAELADVRNSQTRPKPET